MKTYMVFAYDHYYPGGGVNDSLDSFADLQEAKDYCENLNKHFDVTHILNVITGELVYESFN